MVRTARLTVALALVACSGADAPEPRGPAAEGLAPPVDGGAAAVAEPAAEVDPEPVEGARLGWVATFGSPAEEWVQAVAATDEGAALVTGGFAGQVDFDPSDGVAPRISRGHNDVFVAALDAQGALRWAQSVGGPGDDEGEGIALLADGTVVVGGTFHGTVDFDPDAGQAERTAVGEQDVFVAAFDIGGALQWVRSWGGAGDDRLEDLVVTSDGDVVVVGEFYGTVDFDPGPTADERRSRGGRDVFVTRLAPSGDRLWTQLLGGPGEDFGLAASAGPAGSLFVGGRFDQRADLDPGPATEEHESQGPTDDAWIAHLDAAGGHLWSRTFGGPGRDVVLSLEGAPDGSLVAVGCYFETTDLDPGPARDEHPSRGERDIFILRLDRAGAFLWARSLGGSEEDWGDDVAIMADGALVVLGSAGEKVDFDPGRGVDEPPNRGYRDVFLLGLTGEGEYRWAWTLGGRDYDFGLALDRAGASDFVVAGGFSDTADFDPSPVTLERTSAGRRDAFVLHLHDRP